MGAPLEAAAPGPLADVRVLDLSRLVAGNMLSLQLADFGADVIKLEPDKGDPLRHWQEEGVSAWWKVYSRNKRSMRLDLRSPDGKATLRALVPGAQVLIEGFRPGTMEAAGLGPDILHALNPKLVVVRVSGFGQTGPYAERPGFGSLIEAMSGFAAKNGFADKPPALPNLALADMVAGLSGAFATLVALRVAEQPGGRGQVVDLSLLEPLHATLGPDAAIHRLTGRSPSRLGNRVSITAPRNVYRTRDDQWIALSASTQDMAARLFAAIGRPDMIADPRFATNSARLDNVDAVDAIIGGFIGARDLAENLAYFERQEVTVGPVYDPAGFADDPHVRGRGVLVDVDDPEVGPLPMHAPFPRLSLTPGRIRRLAPALGQDEAAIRGALAEAREETR
ncbi:Succinyl-CoA--L-malate CoA-transferase beta subunit [Methylobacterium crusticola]|uniref:Succinyl-CoA--L-malate CoA-transferase beta subunit n=1 Tax=Methylobacterium crusticola TaxID=1697972 RepID=A0ABQ4R6Z1_9HYPH|nr:CoA transferase [Methylobacterium crusticola]GJD53475.1 Succinyl-CoA--L-malate CoA-transferase beta subunit [Methylobacterium crusticola]